MKKILGIFLARGGSKRIKNKNIINFFSKPIIYYPLKEAKKSKIFSKIHISTESIKIKKKLSKLNFKIDFLRPKSLSKDHIKSLEVIRFILNQYKKRNIYFDIIFNIMAPSPMVKSSDFKKALKIFKKYKMKYPLQVFSELSAPIEQAYKINKRGLAIPLFKKSIIKNSQLFPKYYQEDGMFSIYPVKLVQDKKFNFIKRGFCVYKLPKDRSVDIDNIGDLKLAKILFQGHKKI